MEPEPVLPVGACKCQRLSCTPHHKSFLVAGRLARTLIQKFGLSGLRTGIGHAVVLCLIFGGAEYLGFQIVLQLKCDTSAIIHLLGKW